MENRRILSRGFVSLLGLSLLSCGGHGSPTQSSVPDASAEASADAADSGDDSAIAQEMEALGLVDVVALWDPKAKVSLVSSPKSGSTFKLDSLGRPKSPKPVFKLSATPSKNVKQGGVAVLFRKGGQDCGIVISSPPVPLQKDKAKQVTPGLWAVGPPIFPGTTCKLPLTTTQIRLHFGGDTVPFAQKFIGKTYRWEK